MGKAVGGLLFVAVVVSASAIDERIKHFILRFLSLHGHLAVRSSFPHGKYDRRSVTIGVGCEFRFLPSRSCAL